MTLSIHKQKIKLLFAVMIVLFGSLLFSVQKTKAVTLIEMMINMIETLNTMEDYSADNPACMDQESCKKFCAIEKNMSLCVAAARESGFWTEEKTLQANTLLNATDGPNNCKGKACIAECKKEGNEDKCLNFAKKHNLVSKEKSEKIEKFIKLEGPEGCKGKACKRICEKEGNEDKCLAFAEKHELVSKEKSEKIKKFIKAKGPEGCRGKSCIALCKKAGKEDACLKFAKENELLSVEKVERLEKIVKMEGPNGCRGLQCRDQCSLEENQDQCIELASTNKLLPKERIDKLRTFVKEKKPGNCSGTACKTYCSQPENADECLNFAKKTKLISTEVLNRAENKIKETRLKRENLRNKLQNNRGPKVKKSGIESFLVEPEVHELEVGETTEIDLEARDPESGNKILRKRLEGVDPSGTGSVQFEESDFLLESGPARLKNKLEKEKSIRGLKQNQDNDLPQRDIESKRKKQLQNTFEDPDFPQQDRDKLNLKKQIDHADPKGQQKLKPTEIIEANVTMPDKPTSEFPKIEGKKTPESQEEIRKKLQQKKNSPLKNNLSGVGDDAQFRNNRGTSIRGSRPDTNTRVQVKVKNNDVSQQNSNQLKRTVPINNDTSPIKLRSTQTAG